MSLCAAPPEIFGRPFNSEWSIRDRERERGKSFFDKHENEGSLCSPGTKAVKRALKSISSGFTWTPCHIVVV